LDAAATAISEEHFFLGHFEFLKIQNYIHLLLHLFHLLSCSAFSTHADCRAPLRVGRKRVVTACGR
jgi:hypothetical protein